MNVHINQSNDSGAENVPIRRRKNMTTEGDAVQTSVTLPRSLTEKIIYRAEAEGRSRSFVIATLLEKALELEEA